MHNIASPRRPSLYLAALASAVLLTTGCSSMSERERGTAQGAGAGAVFGCVLIGFLILTGVMSASMGSVPSSSHWCTSAVASASAATIRRRDVKTGARAPVPSA